jgi:3-oxoacyl-ACP reductase-like protein
MEVRPAPSRAPRSLVVEVPMRRVTRLPSTLTRAEPSSVSGRCAGAAGGAGAAADDADVFAGAVVSEWSSAGRAGTVPALPTEGTASGEPQTSQ